MDGKWIVIRAYFNKLDVRLSDDCDGEEDILAQFYCDHVMIIKDKDTYRVDCLNDTIIIGSMRTTDRYRIKYDRNEIDPSKIKDLS